MRWLTWLYLAACALALLVLVLGLPAVAGPDADPLAAVFAFLLALPWVLVLDLMGEVPLAVSVALTVGSMALNVVVLLGLARWRAARQAGTTRP